MAHKTLYIYEDESGSLADPKSVVVVVALVAKEHADRLRFIARKVWRKTLAAKGKRYKDRGQREFKYATAHQKERERICALLKNQQVDIFVIGVKTGMRAIADSPQNYGFVLSEVLEALLRHYSEESWRYELRLDRHYTNQEQIDALDLVLRRQGWHTLRIRHIDSKSDSCITLADFVAGAFRDEFMHHNTTLSSCLSERVVYKEETSWDDVSRKWVAKLK